MTAPAEPSGDKPRPRPDGDFRWQALFQHSSDALFVLSRRRSRTFRQPGVGSAHRIVVDRGSRSDLPAAASCFAFGFLRRHPGSCSLSAGGGTAGTVRAAPAVCCRLPAACAGGMWSSSRCVRRPASLQLSAASCRSRRPPSADNTPPIPEKLLALRERVAQRFDFSLLDGVSPRWCGSKGRCSSPFRFRRRSSLSANRGPARPRWRV